MKRKIWVKGHVRVVWGQLEVKLLTNRRYSFKTSYLRLLSKMGFWAYHDARDIMQMLVMLLFATANQNPEKFCFFTTSYVSHATY